MYDKMVMTHNFKSIISGISQLKQTVKGRHGLMVVSGPFGCGKTEVGQWLSINESMAYVSCWRGVTMDQLLGDILIALEVAPTYGSKAKRNQILEHFDERNEPLIIDEADYLVKSGIIQTVKDISDQTNAPIVLMGMAGFERSLSAWPELSDRVTVSCELSTFNKQQLADYIGQVSDVCYDEHALRHILAVGRGRLRKTNLLITAAEAIAKQQNLEIITDEHLAGVK